MANGIWNFPHVVDYTSDVDTEEGVLTTNDIRLFAYGRIAVFKFRLKAATNFPVSFVTTHTLPIKPSDGANYQVMCAKTNTAGSVLVELVGATGVVHVYSYSAAYTDWVTGELLFPI